MDSQRWAGVCNDDRITIMMPHPERTFLTKQFHGLPRTGENYPGLRCLTMPLCFQETSACIPRPH